MTQDDGEHRVLARRKALRRARLVLANQGGRGVECRVVDINSLGARLRFDAAPITGDGIELLLFPESIRITARVAWRSDTEIGVEFSTPIDWLAKHDVAAAQPSDTPGSSR